MNCTNAWDIIKTVRVDTEVKMLYLIGDKERNKQKGHAGCVNEKYYGKYGRNITDSKGE